MSSQSASRVIAGEVLTSSKSVSDMTRSYYQLPVLERDGEFEDGENGPFQRSESWVDPGGVTTIHDQGLYCPGVRINQKHRNRLHHEMRKTRNKPDVEVSYMLWLCRALGNQTKIGR